MNAITKKQRIILDFIEEFIKENRYPPTFQEIADVFGLSSLATVHKHVHNLELKGHIFLRKGRSRSVEIIEIKDSPRFIPNGNNRLWDNKLKCYWTRE